MYQILKNNIIRLLSLRISLGILITLSFFVFLLFRLSLLLMGFEPGSLVGFLSSTSAPSMKVATIAKESVLFGAVYDRPGASKEQLDLEVMRPTLAYLRQLQREGFMVIDTTTDSDGRMSVSVLPEGAVDLTEKLKEIVKTTTP